MNKRLLTLDEAKPYCKTAKVHYALGWTDSYVWDALELLKAQDSKTIKEVVEVIDRTGLIEHTDSPLHETGATILNCPACCWYAYKKEWGIE